MDEKTVKKESNGTHKKGAAGKRPEGKGAAGKGGAKKTVGTKKEAARGARRGPKERNDRKRGAGSRERDWGERKQDTRSAHKRSGGKSENSGDGVRGGRKRNERTSASPSESRSRERHTARNERGERYRSNRDENRDEKRFSSRESSRSRVPARGKRNDLNERNHNGSGERREREAPNARSPRDDRDTSRRDARPRSSRPQSTEPEIFEWVEANDLPRALRSEIRRLDREESDYVAKHLVMARETIETDPDRSKLHALAALHRAAHVPLVREALAMVAYRAGDFATALREFRAYRRMTGDNGYIAFMVDAERGLSRPEKGLQLASEIDRAALSSEQRTQLAIALSGARLDMGETSRALIELDIPELRSERAYPWTIDLLYAYAAVLEDLGRASEAQQYLARAEHVDRVFTEQREASTQLEVYELTELPEGEEEADENAEANLAQAAEAEPQTPEHSPTEQLRTGTIAH